MVSARRQDSITKREFPVLRRNILNQNLLLRQRLLRDRLINSRVFFIDRDDIPAEIVRDINEQQEIPYDLTFAPIINNARDEALAEAIPADEQPDDNSTIEIDLDNPSTRIPLGQSLILEVESDELSSGCSWTTARMDHCTHGNEMRRFAGLP